MIRGPPRSPLFPYRRSSDLAGSSAKRSKKRSMPDGVKITRIRAGSAPSLRKTCGTPRGTNTKEPAGALDASRSEEHTSELQSRQYLVGRLLSEKKIRQGEGM